MAVGFLIDPASDEDSYFRRPRPKLAEDRKWDVRCWHAK